MSKKQFYAYIAECKDKTLYTGYTVDLKQREETHNNGTGANYTRGRKPVKIIYSEKFKTKPKAMQREYAIKQLTRQQKLTLIKKTWTEQIENI